MLSFAPGRICLFGEHQDYLGFPVIAAAIDLGITVRIDEITPRGKIQVNMPDIGEKRSIDISFPIKYQTRRDYLASALNVLEREGYPVDSGFKCTIHGTLPMSAGASSSSAMVVAWIQALGLVNGFNLTRMELARFANLSEVIEMGEAGGWMDHVSSACGGMRVILPDLTTSQLQAPPDAYLVLGDSLETKETVEHIRALRKAVEREIASIKDIVPGFSMGDTACNPETFLEIARERIPELEKDYPRVFGNLHNARLTKIAMQSFEGGRATVREIGQLLSEHHSYLRDYLGVSTGRIEAMINASMDAGAAGCKINGSGFGGTMFALCDNRSSQEAVAAAMKQAGGKSYPVSIDAGARLQKSPCY